MKVEEDDSRVNDRRCLCDLERGYCNPFRNRSMYCQRKSCPAGMQPNQDCKWLNLPNTFWVLSCIFNSWHCQHHRHCGAWWLSGVVLWLSGVVRCLPSGRSQVRIPLYLPRKDLGQILHLQLPVALRHQCRRRERFWEAHAESSTIRMDTKQS